jgi:hypothetical protein
MLGYYVLFVPVSALVRVFHDPLDRAWDAERETYWSFVGADAATGPQGPLPAEEEDVADTSRSRAAAV